MVRIVPPARGVRLATCGVGGLITCMWAYILACKSVACAMDKAWYDAVVIECPMPNWVALSEVCSTFIHTSTTPRLFTLPFS